MLLRRLCGARLAGATTGLGHGRLQVQGWTFTLAVFVATIVVAWRAMVGAVRRSTGLSWVLLWAALLPFCCGVAALVHHVGSGVSGPRLASVGTAVALRHICHLRR